jgi:hypothetical protein
MGKIINKRNITLKHTDSSLTSERVRIILSSSKDSKKLADSVRSLRHRSVEGGKSISFKLSDDTLDKLQLAKG